jgi:hypothetical protein
MMGPKVGQGIRVELVEAMVKAWLVQFGQHRLSGPEAASVAASVMVNVIDEVADRNLGTAKAIAGALLERFRPLAEVVTVEELKRITRGQVNGPASALVIPAGTIN